MSATIATKIGRLFKLRRPVEVDPHTHSNSSNRSLSTRAGREATLHQLQEGYMEVVDTMQALRSHMEEQARRSDRLLNMMEGLPDVLRSIPESNRNQTDVLKAIQGQMRTQTETTGQLSSALSGLSDATTHQHAALGELQKQMQTSNEQGASLRDSLGILSETMEHVTEASQSNVDAMDRIAEQTRNSDQRLRDLFGRTQKHTTVMSAVSWALALAALSIAGYVAVMVAQVADQAQQPTVVESPSPAPAMTAGAPGIVDLPEITVEPIVAAEAPAVEAAPADEPTTEAQTTDDTAEPKADEASDSSESVELTAAPTDPS